jgi:hypothetical protein
MTNMNIDSGNGRREIPAALNRASWRQIPARPVDEWILSADLGMVNDFTALVGLHHKIVATGGWVADEVRHAWKENQIETLEVPFLERIPLGTSYPRQVEHIARILQRPPLDRATLCCDSTGVGEAVFSMFVEAGLKPTGITITSGSETTQPATRRYHVPKATLISCLDSKLGNGLVIASDLLESPTLKTELGDLQRTVSAAGRASYAAGRVAQNDDLVLSLAIAVWFAVGRVRNTVEWKNNAF